MERVSMSLCVLERQCRRNIEAQVVSTLPHQNLLAYLEFASYDETPMVTRVRLHNRQCPRDDLMNPA
eukprot:2327845-Amphidinium_carterae.1